MKPSQAENELCPDKKNAIFMSQLLCNLTNTDKIWYKVS